MPIDRQNTAYDPQDARRRVIDPAPMPTHTEHDDGPFAGALSRPPKPGIPVGLLAWTLAGATITITTVIVLVMKYW